jgi:hypothetical protein
MKNIIKLFRITAPVIILALIIASCGGAGSESLSGDDTPGTQQPGTQQPDVKGYRAAYSYDGINWTVLPDRIFNSGNVYFPSGDIIYGNGKWIAQYRDTEGYRIAYSQDGINWNTSGNLFDDWRNITFANGKFFAAAVDSNVIAYSTDGINWTNVTVSALRGGVNSVAWGGSKYIAVGYNASSSKNYATSADGVIWTAGTGNFSSSGRREFSVWGNGVWIAASSSSGWMLNMDYSTDGGSTWKWTYVKDEFNYPVNAMSGDIYDINFGNNKFVAVGTSNNLYPGVGVIVYSEDGVNWTIAKKGDGNYISSLAFGNRKWVAELSTYSGDKILYSQDGISWNIPNNKVFGDNGEICDIGFGGGKFVAVGYVD